MSQKLIVLFCVSIILLFSVSSFSQESVGSDLSLDDNLMADTIQNSPKDNPPPTENSNLATPLEILQTENALYGFSVGLVLASQPLYEKYTATSVTKVNNRDLQSDPIQSFGVMLRYAVAPFYKLGTDFNVSYLKSINHKNTKFLDEITTLKGEFNLCYAVNFLDKAPIYFLGGIGVETVSGRGVEDVLNRYGIGAQIGGGVVLFSTINIEGVYAYYQHRISNKIYDSNINAVPSASIDTESAKIINQGLVMRGTYSFKF